MGSSSLEDILTNGDEVSIEKQALSQHPCTPDTVLLALQVDTGECRGRMVVFLGSPRCPVKKVDCSYLLLK